jgi:hypothetical protein
MDKRFVVLVFVLIAVVGITLIWRLRTTPPTASVATPASAPVQPAPQAPSSHTTSQERQLPGGPYVSSDPRWAIVREKDKSDRNWEWRMPINFYGRVLDENEHAVVAAKVHAQWSDFSANGASSEESLTDAQGVFSITGKTGRGITIRVAKEGYYTPKRQQTSFDYAGFWEANYYEPDSARPVTFHLRKKAGREALVAGETQPPLSANGSSTKVDLLNGGQVSTNGQMEIMAVTNTEKYPPRVFDWKASIIVPDGGLIEHDLEFPFEAPEEGYKSKIEFSMPADAGDWKRSIEKGYFIRFGTPPKYGRIHVRFNGASQKVFISYTVNPSGSRNLEANTNEQFSTP